MEPEPKNTVEMDVPVTAAERIARAERDHVMQFFEYEHLPANLQAVSKPFGDLARIIVAEGEMPAGTPIQFPLPRNPERTKALNKLLEAKDAAVRASKAG